MAQRVTTGTRRLMDPRERVGEFDSSEDIRWAPAERQHAGRIDHANAEIIRIARGMLDRIVDLLK